jgi:hypothetical protein
LIDPFSAAVAHMVLNNQIPDGHHGKELPESMPFIGDMFFVEGEGGDPLTVRVHVWYGHGHWEKGPALKRKGRARG